MTRLTIDTLIRRHFRSFVLAVTQGTQRVVNGVRTWIQRPPAYVPQ